MSRKPNLVSFTGADDEVLVSDLVVLSRRYPSIEWGILYYPEREGTVRNPSTAWRESFLDQPFRATAVHVCGIEAYRKLLDDDNYKPTLQHLCRYSRIQVNVNARGPDFTKEEVLKVYNRLLLCGNPLILQYYDTSREVINEFLLSLDQQHRSLIQILFDESRGLGIAPTSWHAPLLDPSPGHNDPLFCGYAGQLGPETIQEQLPHIQAAVGDHELGYWIDMESGVRVNNRFDKHCVAQTMNNI